METRIGNILHRKFVFVFFTLAPMLIFYTIFLVVPKVTAFYYPFTEYNGISEPVWVGLGNFVTLARDFELWGAMKNNFFYWFIATPINFLAALIVSFILVKKPYRENRFYRILYYFPAILPGVITALMWQFAFHGRYGIFNAVINAVGINIGEFYWLTDATAARWAMIIPMVWGGWAGNMLIFMGAIQSVPVSLYESAELDGASDLGKLFLITVPVIWETMKTMIFFSIIGLFGAFELILVMTNGGPAGATEVVGTYMYKIAFGAESVAAFGYAAAVGLLLFVILSAVSIIAFRFMDRCEAIEMAG
ncbi:MAG: sugar ABC transporter permease [Clostridiaceae bacterium]|nr:sugar ABC transporter permease [Clostridiaceae bacterium]